MNWFEPAQFVYPDPAKACLFARAHIADQHPHDHRAGVPATCRKSAEMRFCGGFIIKMEGLRIIFAGEFGHLITGDFITTKADLAAHFEVFKMLH